MNHGLKWAQIMTMLITDLCNKSHAPRHLSSCHSMSFMSFISKLVSHGLLVLSISTNSESGWWWSSCAYEAENPKFFILCFGLQLQTKPAAQKILPFGTVKLLNAIWLKRRIRNAKTNFFKASYNNLNICYLWLHKIVKKKEMNCYLDRSVGFLLSWLLPVLTFYHVDFLPSWLFALLTFSRYTR